MQLYLDFVQHEYKLIRLQLALALCGCAEKQRGRVKLDFVHKDFRIVFACIGLF